MNAQGADRNRMVFDVVQGIAMTADDRVRSL